MRDGVSLATDLYLPPLSHAPTIAVRTPYGRANDRMVGAFLSFARRGYAVLSQDCRGTGDSEPDAWDYYVYESEDGYDLVEWVTQQGWFDGFVGACGGSYVGQTQWGMALHPRMSTIAPEVSGLGVAINTAHLYMLVNAYAKSVGKGEDKLSAHYTDLERLMLEQTLKGGFFNEPLHVPFPPTLVSRYRELTTLAPHDARQWLWERYCALPSAQRAAFIRQARDTKGVSMVDIESLSAVFGHRIPHDAHSIPHGDSAALARSLHAPALMITGWYDWALNDALETWGLLTEEGSEAVRSNSRLIIAPNAHNMPGYHEGIERHAELQHNHRTASIAALLLHWYASVREERTADWPRVIYYLMGANEWRASPVWPPTEAQPLSLFLASGGTLTAKRPDHDSLPDSYVYDPDDPTPTVGGSIVSTVYPPGSVDVSEAQRRSDVLTYTTPPLDRALDVVGPLRVILYASSSAIDTDFCARLSDVFPDGRAIQLQSGILRARYRNVHQNPEFLEPGRIYTFHIDLWATANRFKPGHRLRLDISSADFPRFDRNSNRGGEDGTPIPAAQKIYHDIGRPSELILMVIGQHGISDA